MNAQAPKTTGSLDTHASHATGLSKSNVWPHGMRGIRQFVRSDRFILAYHDHVRSAAPNCLGWTTRHEPRVPVLMSKSSAPNKRAHQHLKKKRKRPRRPARDWVAPTNVASGLNCIWNDSRLNSSTKYGPSRPYLKCFRLGEMRNAFAQFAFAMWFWSRCVGQHPASISGIRVYRLVPARMSALTAAHEACVRQLRGIRLIYVAGNFCQASIVAPYFVCGDRLYIYITFGNDDVHGNVNINDSESARGCESALLALFQDYEI